MSTFSELLSVMRREVISENSASGGFSDADDLLPMLYNASAEIAAHLGFPVVSDATVSWSEGDLSFSAPADMVWPQELMVNGRRVELTNVSTVLRKQGLEALRTPRFFAYDPRQASDVLFAPEALYNQTAGSAVLRYVKAINTSLLTQGSTVWDGLFPDFHWLVPLRAGANAWDSLGESERAGYFNDKFGQGLQVFAARLGVTHVGNLMVPPEARNDKGSSIS
jgi:hypothetical protein